MNITAKSSVRRFVALVPIAALTFALSACGGSSSERPSVQDVSAGLTKLFDTTGQGDLFDQEVVTCIAEGLHDSDLDDSTLQKVADGDENAGGSVEEAEAMTRVMTAVTVDCMIP